MIKNGGANIYGRFARTFSLSTNGGGRVLEIDAWMLIGEVSVRK